MPFLCLFVYFLCLFFSYRNTYSRKYRRYVNDGGNRISHKAQVSSSQLSIEVSELHAGINGRLEITCLATIPAHVGPGEQFADYKTYSVKSKFYNFLKIFFPT